MWLPDESPRKQSESPLRRTPYNQTVDPHFHLVRTFYLAPIQGAPPWMAGGPGSKPGVETWVETLGWKTHDPFGVKISRGGPPLVQMSKLHALASAWVYYL